jgi:hypothetical protein
VGHEVAREPASAQEVSQRLAVVRRGHQRASPPVEPFYLRQRAEKPGIG